MVPVLSFFTGAGLLDLGMHQAGFDVVWRNEYYPAFVSGFQHGFANHLQAKSTDFPVNSQSITEITPYSIRNEAFGGKLWPEIFGIVGGPPCPDFSVGGRNKGKEGDNGKLTGVYFDQVKGLKPTFFIFENVKGILSTLIHREYLVEQLLKLSDEYVFDIKLVNSLNLGVPQDRERVIIIGFHKSYLTDVTDQDELKELILRNRYLLGRKLSRNDFEKHQWLDWPIDANFENAKNRFIWPKTNPFGQTTKKPHELPRELCVGHYLTNLSRLKNQSDFFNPISDKFNFVAEGDTSRKSFKRLHRWRYSPTAAYGNNEVHLHPYKARRLSVREAMRIQTIPDTFSLPKTMTLSDKFKTIGNGVPVKLSTLIAQKIHDAIRAEKIIVGT